MRNLNFLKLFYGLMLVMVSTAFVSCVDDNDDTEAPYLEVSPTTLIFGLDGQPASGSQASFDISTNRSWKATVKDDKSWVTLSKYEGEGSATIQVSIPENINDEASVVIEISNKVGVLMSETVKISSGTMVEPTVIYNETFGTNGTEDYPYPFVDTYEGWVKTGDGSSTVEYSGKAATLRNKSKASAGYDRASGSTKLFFGSDSYFTINKISLNQSQTKLTLNFGAAYYDGDTKDDEFKPEQFHVYLSADGTTWTNAIKYTTQKAENGWVYGTSNFTLKNSTEYLYVKFSVDIASKFSLDDPTLSTGNGGDEIDLGNGGEEPEPGEAKVITIPELNAMMTPTETVVDATADRYFEAVVQNDVEGGNYSFNNLILATENATAAGNGITLYGSQVEPTTIKVKKGDKVKVTLYKGLAKTKNFNGMFKVTGGKEDTWAKVEKLGSTATITPIVITADKLADYQGMTVTISNATPATAGIWANTSSISSHTFTAEGTDFVVFCKKEATVFIDKAYKIATGNISGLAAVNSNKGQLVPRNMDDVAAFNATSSDPLITEVNPTSLNFPASGDTKTVEVTVINQGSNKLSVSGLNGTLNASVNGNTITVIATENNGSAVNQTLTISLENGNSKTVTVTQEAKGSIGGDVITMTKDDIVNGKTGSVELGSNAYGQQNVNDVSTWYTWSSNSLNFTGARICIAPANNGGGIQVQGNASDATKQGRIANVSAISNIQSIEIVLKVVKTSTYAPAYNVYAGTSANPTSADTKIEGNSSVETIDNFKVYTETFDLSKGNYSYFNIMNDLAGALYIDSIKITYKK